MSFRVKFRNGSQGLSLVELLVAIALGAILMAGAISLFINNRDTYKVTNELSRLQETARYALDMMVKDIRMAGYFGCADRLDTVTVNIPVPDEEIGSLWDFNLDTGAGTIVPPIEGMDSDVVEDGFQPSGFEVTVGSNGLAGEVLADTDAIAIRYIAGNMNDVAPANGTLDYQVTANATSGSNSIITVDSTAGFASAQVAAVADCGGSDIFQISDAPTETTVEANELSRGYKATSSPIIAPLVGVRYYIGDNGRGPNGEVHPSLYRTIITPGALTETNQELFEGVERMHILYGVDSDDDGAPNSYVAAGVEPLDAGSPPTNWANVVSVRIGLVVRTVDEHGRDPDTTEYPVNDKTFTPDGDHRQRRVFTTTAMVRNLS